MTAPFVRRSDQLKVRINPAMARNILRALRGLRVGHSHFEERNVVSAEPTSLRFPALGFTNMSCVAFAIVAPLRFHCAF